MINNFKILKSLEILKNKKLLTLCKFRFSNRELEKIKFKFVYLIDKKEIEVEAKEGEHILEIAHNHDIDLEGACDASLACSTCHVILENDIYDKLPKAKDEEEDLLDLAYGLKETSRLGCQVHITRDFNNTKVYIPSATRNLYVDGKKPAKH
jgi:ferredoxin